MELEAENSPSRAWSPVVPVPSETVAVAMFQLRRLPISRALIIRYLAIVAAVTVLFAAAAYGYSSMGTKLFGARTEIEYPLNVQLASGNFLRTDVQLQTQIVTIKSHVVLDPVAAQFHTNYDALSKEIKATVVNSSEVVMIEADDPNIHHALAIAGAVATQYLKFLGPTPAGATETYLKREIAANQAQIDSLNRQLAGAANNSQAATALQDQLSGLTNINTQLQNQFSQAVATDLSTPHVEQLTQPYALSGAVAPKPLIAGIAGALAGMMVGAALVAMLLRRRLKRSPLEHVG